MHPHIHIHTQTHTHIHIYNTHTNMNMRIHEEAHTQHTNERGSYAYGPVKQFKSMIKLEI